MIIFQQFITRVCCASINSSSNITKHQILCMAAMLYGHNATLTQLQCSLPTFVLTTDTK